MGGVLIVDSSSSWREFLRGVLVSKGVSTRTFRTFKDAAAAVKTEVETHRRDRVVVTPTFDVVVCDPFGVYAPDEVGGPSLAEGAESFFAEVSNAQLGVRTEVPLYLCTFAAAETVDQLARRYDSIRGVFPKASFSIADFLSSLAELGQLHEIFLRLFGPNEPPQDRGYSLEYVLARLFQGRLPEAGASFRRNSGAEQIDGYFWFEGWYYLLECTWEKEGADIDKLDHFQLKVLRSGTQASGVFLSVTGWSKNVPEMLRLASGHRQLVFLMDGCDLCLVLAQDIGLSQLLRRKRTCMTVQTEPFLSAWHMSEVRGSMPGILGRCQACPLKITVADA